MSDDETKHKLDAILMALQQITWVLEHDRQVAQNQRDGKAFAVQRPAMAWNLEQALKVIGQGLSGEKPEFDQ
jgi:hypothetical protein